MEEGIIKDLKDYIVEKTKSQFIGTFLVTCILHNWKLFYTIIEFDKETTLSQKISQIETYLVHPWCDLLIEPIGFAIIVITGYLILRNITEGLHAFSDIVVKPKIYEIIDKKGSVVDKVTHDKVRASFLEMKQQRDSAKEELSDMVQEKKAMEAEYVKVKAEQFQYKAEAEKQKATERDLEQEKKEKNKLQHDYDNLLRTTEANISLDLDEIQGKWRAKIIDQSGRQTLEDFVIIDEYIHIDGAQKYRVSDYKYDKRKNLITFKKTLTNSIGSSWVNLMKQGQQTLVGFEDTNNSSIIYQRNP